MPAIKIEEDQSQQIKCKSQIRKKNCYNIVYYSIEMFFFGVAHNDKVDRACRWTDNR